ncbi:hypothetical protein [Prosthecobacter fusiformis]|nr:hypothetical protein [Prosthecobacter fusiformis]
MIALHPTVYGTFTPEAQEARDRLKAWLDSLSPRQLSLLRAEFQHPEKPGVKPMTQKARAAIEAITGYSPARQAPTERPDWGLAIRALR